MFGPGGKNNPGAASIDTLELFESGVERDDAKRMIQEQNPNQLAANRINDLLAKH